MTEEEKIICKEFLNDADTTHSCTEYKLLMALLEQESKTFKWCTDCREYNQEKHCCHRWSKVIRDTVEEMKQEYIEREVLDKIRAEIEALPIAFTSSFEMKQDCLDILDKYKGES